MDRDSGAVDRLAGRIAGREAVVGVMGLGYVGLPLAVTIARAGFVVVGLDTDPVSRSTLLPAAPISAPS